MRPLFKAVPLEKHVENEPDRQEITGGQQEKGVDTPGGFGKGS